MVFIDDKRFPYSSGIDSCVLLQAYKAGLCKISGVGNVNGETGTLQHDFLECPAVLALWREVLDWQSNQATIFLHLAVSVVWETLQFNHSFVATLRILSRNGKSPN